MAKNANFVSHKKSKLKNQDGSPQLPLASALVEGEIAINFAENVETISIKNESGDVVTFSSDNYYTEKKLGSGFTGANSGVTVTEVIDNLDLGNEVEISSGETPTEETIELWVDTSVNPITVEVYTKAETDSLLLTKVNTSDVVQTINSETSASTNPVATSAVYNFVTAHTPTIEIDQVIDSGTSASTDAVSTSAVYGFVTSYTPSITVDQVLDNTTSASTNPVSSKAVYDAVTDNELVWTNAYVALSGAVSAHTANTEIHVTAADKEKLHTHSNKSALDAITGNVGTMAYQNTSSYSSATEVNTALGNKANTSDLSDYYQKSETSGATEISTALGGKSDTATTYTKTEVDARDLWVSGTGTNSVAQKGGNNTAGGSYSHAEGMSTKANGGYSHAEGNSTTASSSSSHAEGYNTTANGSSSHAEGYYTVASGTSSHAEGMSTTASGGYSHAEGYMTKANGDYSHTEGNSTTASGTSSHAEGDNTKSNGYASHAEGQNTTASGVNSHVEGYYTITLNNSEHASGRYNNSVSASTTFGDGGNTLFSVGNGTYDVRHNAFEIRQNGDIYIVSGGTDIKLQDNIGKVDVISAITPSNSGSTAPIATKVVAENELTVSNALNGLNAAITAHTADTSIHVTSNEKSTWNALQTQINAIQDFLKPRDYVEIGGVKWATMNIGATGITDTGLYFQWGDISGYTASQVGSGGGKKYFGWTDYKYGNGTSSPGATGMTKYNSTDSKTVLDASDDAEKSAWFGWRMPTTDEYAALGNAVNTAWTDNYQGSGVAGMICTDKTDSTKTLFFPACGYCYDGSVSIVGSYGDYWSSSLDSSRIHSAYYLYFRNDYVNWQDYRNRCYGFPVRGVVG